MRSGGLANMNRLIVDGMNVIGSRPTGWWKDRHGAALRFVERLQRFVAATGDEVTIVLDGKPIPALPEGRHLGVLVLYPTRPNRENADDRIVHFVSDDAQPDSLLVFTADRQLRSRVRALGAEVSGPTKLLRRLDELNNQP